MFYIIFFFEAFFKVLCLEKFYFRDPYNVFDFFVICITGFSMIINFTGVVEVGSWASIFRVFRLGRILRLVIKADMLRKIFNTFIHTLPSLFYIGLILILVIFIYTVMGVELFSYIQWQNSLTEDANFSTFAKSFITLFRCSTGEGWNEIMDDMTRQI